MVVLAEIKIEIMVFPALDFVSAVIPISLAGFFSVVPFTLCSVGQEFSVLPCGRGFVIVGVAVDGVAFSKLFQNRDGIIEIASKNYFR